MNPRENRRPPIQLRIALRAAVILIVVCFVGYVAVKVYPFTRHSPVAKRMEVAILRLSEEVPPGLTDEQWAYCIVWTWMMHGNYGSIHTYVPTDDLNRIERGLQERIDRGADLAQQRRSVGRSEEPRGPRLCDAAPYNKRSSRPAVTQHTYL